MTVTCVRAQPAFAWLEDAPHQAILTLLNCWGKEGRFVGGAVRSSLMDLTPHEWDVATSHLPEDVMELAQQQGYKAFPTGLQHGTVTVLVQGIPYEVTTLRRDLNPTGRHAQVAFSSCWEEDACRRDFTMNALYLDATGNLYDSVGGYEDILHRRIRFIGMPEQRIQEDHLRILRFFRFQAWYGHTWDVPSLNAACALAHLLRFLSKERITQEVLKIVEAPFPWHVLEVMEHHGILSVIGCGWTPQTDHLIHVEHALKKAASQLVRLSTLMPSHNKAPLFSLSSAQRKVLHVCADPYALDDPWILETSQELFEANLWCHALQKEAFLSPKDLSHWYDHTYTKLLQCRSLPFPVTGKDIQNLGVPQGPMVGKILHHLRQIWLTREESLPLPTQQVLLDEARAMLLQDHQEK